MLIAVYSNRFKKDIKLQNKRGKDPKKIKEILSLLIAGKKLAEKNKDHSLSGNYADCRECHVDPDWLLIYSIEGNKIYFFRTGTHSDLFQ
ncbi:MAG: type II toxin-antitoxin system YafQ family toxin [Candidatus Omnitrophica bacterium]|nr:type II toxin-antitoxin system YafQ family toxin [Candidatus Omnitrophota bacterium]